MMDRLLGSIIDDYSLYRIIEGIIIVLILVAVYQGIQIMLIMKFPKKGRSESESTTPKKSFIRGSAFIFISGFFMLIHELSEGLEKDAPDFATYEFFELMAILGLVLFMLEWKKIMQENT